MFYSLPIWWWNDFIMKKKEEAASCSWQIQGGLLNIFKTICSMAVCWFCTMNMVWNSSVQDKSSFSLRKNRKQKRVHFKIYDGFSGVEIRRSLAASISRQGANRCCTSRQTSTKIDSNFTDGGMRQQFVEVETAWPLCTVITNNAKLTHTNNTQYKSSFLYVNIDALKLVQCITGKRWKTCWLLQYLCLILLFTFIKLNTKNVDDLDKISRNHPKRVCMPSVSISGFWDESINHAFITNVSPAGFGFTGTSSPHPCSWFQWHVLSII